MSKTIRIALDEDGFEGQWIEVVDPGQKSPRQFREIAALAESKDPQAGTHLLRALLSDWSVLDPATGSPLPPPGEADPDDIPLRISKRFADEVTKLMQELVPFRG